MQANIPPLLRLIDQHHFLGLAGAAADLDALGAAGGPLSEIERNILRRKLKTEQQSEANKVATAANAVKAAATAGEETAPEANNLVLKDMPMVQFYSQLGHRGLEMIKYLRKYDFQEKKENKYPTKAIMHLVKVLLDQTLRDHHHIVLQSLSYIVKNLGADCVEFLPVIVPPIMILIRSNDLDLIQDLYSCLYAIVVAVPRDVVKYADLIFETINEVMFSQQQAVPVLDLVRLLNVNCKDSLVTDMYLLLPRVLQLIEFKRQQQELYVSIKAVATLAEFHLSILNNHLYIVVPQLLRICSNGVTAEEIKLNIEVLRAFDSFKACASFKEHLGQIAHQLLQIMETHLSQTPYVQTILELLTNLAERLTLDFAPYIPLVQKALKRNKLACEKFDAQAHYITKINPIGLFQANMEQSLLEEQKELLMQQAGAHLSAAHVSVGGTPGPQRRSMVEIQEARKKYVNFE